jgi:hypothetical protein
MFTLLSRLSATERAKGRLWQNQYMAYGTAVGLRPLFVDNITLAFPQPLFVVSQLPALEQMKEDECVVRKDFEFASVLIG